MKKEKCSSCKKIISVIQGSARFPCPNCAKHEFVRCGDCRKIAAKYKCPECGFEGPN